MSTRRDFLAQIASGACVAAAAGGTTAALAQSPAGSRSDVKGNSSASLPAIKSVRRLDDTIVRLGGDGAIMQTVWAANDDLLLTIGDGCGWPESARDKYCNTRLFAMRGDPLNATFVPIETYPEAPIYDLLVGWRAMEQGDEAALRASGPMYYCMGKVAVGNHVYQFLSSQNRLERSLWPKKWGDLLPTMNAAKLIYSPDNGRTWHNQDGSTPVVLETMGEQSAEKNVFFKEADGAFASLDILQMGRGYEENRDGYVYAYSVNGARAPHEIVMFRVPKEKILQRAAYEYFSGRDKKGGARWSKDIEARQAVHAFAPTGWKASSFTYNAPLDLYMMAASIADTDMNGQFIAGKVPTLGMWVARTPWGPWTQVHEELPWKPAGDPQSRALAAIIIPKWIAPDGKSFWLSWVDIQGPEVQLTDPIVNPRDEADFIRGRSQWHQTHPYFGFNAQRVELVLA